MEGPVHPPSDRITVQTHNHWLRVACDGPAEPEFFALVHHLLNYTIRTLIDYKGGPVAEPTMIAQIAADDNHRLSYVAHESVQNARNQMITISVLASYLLGDGDPRNVTPLVNHPNAVVLQPVDDTGINSRTPLNPLPPRPLSTIGPVSDMDAEQLYILRMDARARVVLATINRCFHGAQKHGCVLAAIFLTMATRVPEIQEAVRGQLTAEGLNGAQCDTLFGYVDDELHALCLYPMSYDNATELWNTWWLAISETLRRNDFAYMQQKTKERDEASWEQIRQVHEDTRKKREARARAQMRKRNNAKGHSVQEEDVEVLAGLSDEETEIEQLADGLSKDSLQDVDKAVHRMGELAGVIDDDSDYDDDLDDLTHRG